MLKRLAATLAWIIIPFASHCHPQAFVKAAEIIQFFHFFQWQYFRNIHTIGNYADHINSDIQYLVYLENKTLAALLQDLSSIEKMKDEIAVYETWISRRIEY